MREKKRSIDSRFNSQFCLMFAFLSDPSRTQEKKVSYFLQFYIVCELDEEKTPLHFDEETNFTPHSDICMCVCEMIIKTAKTRSTLEHINYNSLTDRKIIFPVYFTQFCSTYIIPYILNDTSIPLYSDTEE